MACQESAGGILACLSEHAALGVSGLYSLTLPFLSTRMKRFDRKKSRIGDVAEQGLSV